MVSEKLFWCSVQLATNMDIEVTRSWTVGRQTHNITAGSKPLLRSFFRWTIYIPFLENIAFYPEYRFGDFQKKMMKISVYVSTLPDITQKLKPNSDELKHWHVGPYSSGHHRQSRWPWQTRLHACVKAKERHFKHLLWYSHTTDSFQSHIHTKRLLSHYWEEDNISFRFCVMSGSVET